MGGADGVSENPGVSASDGAVDAGGLFKEGLTQKFISGCSV